MKQYVWQSSTWPCFRWDSVPLLGPLAAARRAQGKLLAVVRELGLEAEVNTLADEAISTSAVEGERLAPESVRSSVARRLGLPVAGLPPADRRIDGLVEVLLDATRNYRTPLTAERVKGWQAALFPGGFSGMTRIVVGDWRRGDQPMQVVSGPIGREKVHYEAPPSETINTEIGRLLVWLEASKGKIDGLFRAAVAHFWFVSIHPFDDGNGRVGRALADLILAQDESTGCRLYSVSAQILAEREDYYRELEAAQKGDGDLTAWISWFLACLERSMVRAWGQVELAMAKARFWRQPACEALNARQKKVLNRLLDAGSGGFEGGLTNGKYRAMTKASPETAKRDLATLVGLGLLVRNPGGGRSASYSLSPYHLLY